MEVKRESLHISTILKIYKISIVNGAQSRRAMAVTVSSIVYPFQVSQSSLYVSRAKFRQACFVNILFLLVFSTRSFFLRVTAV